MSARCGEHCGRLFNMSRTHFPLSPPLRQPGKEVFQTLAARYIRRVGSVDGGKRRLRLSYRMQQRYRIQSSLAVRQSTLGLLAHVISLQQMVAWRGLLAVTVLDAAAIPTPLQELERSLEVIHI